MHFTEDNQVLCFFYWTARPDLIIGRFVENNNLRYNE